uniref:Uncharacterized protein n=1 Tax=Timema poppense TaxID=170557 RepID=A0A7R9GVW1_TIMPO|nr:unnamed protein product [Timema poppensis]
MWRRTNIRREYATVHRSCSGELPNFHCTDESKITLRQVCDGAMDCPDGSDEVRPLCKHISCPVLRSFQCMYGACVSKTVVCDGKLDCADGSDESHCGHENDSCK